MAKRIIYPLYQLGNPQMRLFRPPFTMTLVRPGKEQPPDTVQFRIPMEITKFDVRNYLETIYSVPVAAVRTRIQYFLVRERTGSEVGERRGRDRDRERTTRWESNRVARCATVPHVGALPTRLSAPTPDRCFKYFI
ncbi:39S ribosomal protein L23, mitochondrial isoform X2 [Triplophysa rosa]|uniref:39S ribosomal protein L23, mitochondrial isoform X2 n=1 Tax=Triplophysa rosa TaxID=992332 RepID=UPI0025461FC9|nr:39S ribosomal protein L23, mitochondrial isoform X2 [Triplophysa rosa]